MDEVNPIRLDTVDPDIEQLILSRLETFDEDVKAAVPAREALEKIRKGLKQFA